MSTKTSTYTRTEKVKELLKIVDYDAAACHVNDRDYMHELSITGFHHAMRDYLVYDYLPDMMEEEKGITDFDIRKYLNKEELKDFITEIESECKCYGDWADEDPYGEFDFDDDEEDEREDDE